MARESVRPETVTDVSGGMNCYPCPEWTVASLWKVDDAATAELMQRFYAATLRERKSPAAALRQAQVKMLRQPRWSSPFFWAAFEIQGEWR